MSDTFNLSDLDKEINFGNKVKDFYQMVESKKEELVRAFIAQYGGVKPDSICLVLAQEQRGTCFFPMLKSDAFVFKVMEQKLSLMPSSYTKIFDTWVKIAAEVEFKKSQEELVDPLLAKLAASVLEYMELVATQGEPTDDDDR